MAGRDHVTRRTFMQIAAAATAGAGIGSQVSDAAAQENPQSNTTKPTPSAKTEAVHKLGSDRHLFIDDWMTDQKQNVETCVNPAENRQLVVIADKPWETGGITNYINVFYDEGAQEYRMYYVPVHME